MVTGPTEDRSFLGRGWSYPTRFLSTEGHAVMSDEEQDVAEAILILLLTRPGERVMHPRFGCALRDHVFEPINDETAAGIEHTIERAILFFEPRIRLIDVNVTIQDWFEGKFQVNLDYEIRQTNARNNIVIPFFEHEGTLRSDIPYVLT